jgi:hypothetical protein
MDLRQRPSLTLWASVVVCTLENEAETLWDESDVSGLTPEQEVEGKSSSDDRTDSRCSNARLHNVEVLYHLRVG